MKIGERSQVDSTSNPTLNEEVALWGESDQPWDRDLIEEDTIEKKCRRWVQHDS